MLLLIPMLLLGWVLNNFISFNPVSMVVGLVLILLFGVVISLFLPYLVKYSSDI
ncbi:hypothetical protein JCM21714_4116 [Gracilibacillus boraciitolerans JCM 21714]|uniref:Uncharacterized protein n=2 Tax=Gracilibacillus boraciitolerans TaxID=307521 RepID=W4VP34_9BACI|nr:hypothetical protein JCM21714_4116 [Gracilibacillus boraciitolerans JCM 21714]